MEYKWKLKITIFIIIDSKFYRNSLLSSPAFNFVRIKFILETYQLNCERYEIKIIGT